MVVLPIHMHNQQNDTDNRLNADSADCMPALFSGGAYSIRSNEAVVILEYQCRHFE